MNREPVFRPGQQVGLFNPSPTLPGQVGLFTRKELEEG